MWVVVLFDLPTGTRDERRVAGSFRRQLLGRGFSRIQFSVYARYLDSRAQVPAVDRAVGQGVPAGGLVRILAVSDFEWATMSCYEGKTRAQPEPRPTQLVLFESRENRNPQV